jgi:hypothetical protein
VLVGSGFGGLGHSADHDDVVGIVGIDDRDGNVGVAVQVGLLGPALGRVEDEVVTVAVDPDRGELGPSSWLTVATLARMGRSMRARAAGVRASVMEAPLSRSVGFVQVGSRRPAAEGRTLRVGR